MATEGHQKQMEELDAEILMDEQAAGLAPPPNQPEESGSPSELEPPNGAVTVEEHQAGSREEAAGSENQVVEQPPVQPLTPKAAAGRRSWKTDFLQLEKRYSGLRAASDQFKFEAKRDLATVQESNVALHEENQKLRAALADASKESPPDIRSAFTEEDVDILGEGTINSFNTAVNTAVNAAVGPINAELLQMKKAEMNRLKGTAEANRKGSIAMFRKRLGDLVPDYQTINSNPKFIEWLREQDPYGGAPRFSFFKKAEDNGDVGRVAQYFVEFRQMYLEPEQNLAEHAAPLGGGGPGAGELIPPDPQAAPTFTMASINQFYDDVIAGKFKGREDIADKLEKQIDVALMTPGGVVG